MSYAPTGETVAVDWCRATLTVPDALIDHAVPALGAAFLASGAVVVTMLDDDSDHDTGLRRTVAQVDAYAYKAAAAATGEIRPDWGKAHQIAEEVVAACLASSSSIARTVTRSGYDAARIRDARKLAGPVRTVDPQRLARYRIDVRLTWTPEA